MKTDALFLVDDCEEMEKLEELLGENDPVLFPEMTYDITCNSQYFSNVDEGRYGVFMVIALIDEKVS